MLNYNLKLAFKAIRRNPVMTGLMIAAIAVGIGISMTTLTVYYMMNGNPIPNKSDELYAITLDSWNPIRPFDDDQPERGPHQLTFHDAERLVDMGQGYRQTAMFESSLIVQPPDPEQLPFEAGVRVTGRDFFSMFEVPFLFGDAWDSNADQGAEPVVVLTQELNEKLFGGEDSVGRSLTMQDTQFVVAGVIDRWEPTPRFYDPINGAFQEVNEMFIPYSLTRSLELISAGSDWGWKSEDITSFEQWLNSESVWVQYFVELESDSQRGEYLAHLDAYVNEQKKLGRFERTLNNDMFNVMEWMAYHDVVDNDAKVLVGLSFLFLVVCLLSTIALVLTKFLGRKSETSLRRALGASQNAIFKQQLVEAGVIGLIGGLMGLGLAWLGLQGIEYLYEAPPGLVSLDMTMTLTAVTVAILSGVIAGVYPAWRICQIPPATQLKTQ